MTRYHTTAEGNIPFTEEEELEADQREAEFNASLLPREKVIKNDEIMRKYDSEKKNPVVFLNATFNGGIESAQMAKSKADMVIRQQESLGNTAPFPVTFNDIGNVAVEMDTDQLQDLAVAIGVEYESVYQKKARLKRDLAALNTLEEVNSFDVENQWNL